MDDNLKECRLCKIWKNKLTDFYKMKSVKKDGLYPRCKECSNKVNKKYLLDNPDLRKKYTLNQKNALTEEKKAYYEMKRKERVSKNPLKYKLLDKKRKSSKGYRQRKSLRRRMERVLKNTNLKMPKFEFTNKQLISHLESLFTEGMTWDNYSTFWVLDHIKPICSFNISDPNQLRQINLLSNIQPLTYKQNEAKGILDYKLRYIYSKEELIKIGRLKPEESLG